MAVEIALLKILNLKKNVLGTPDQQREDRFTPTPRRSIHSYKVTETTKTTMTTSKDGVISKDVVHTKETTESR